MKITIRKRLVTSVAGIAAVGLVLAGCSSDVNDTAADTAADTASEETPTDEAAPTEEVAVAQCGDWTIAMHGWVGYTASAQVLAEVAKNDLGCNISQTKLDEAAITYDAMEAGSADVIVEDWGGGRWQDWIDRGAIVDAGSNGNVGLIGMYVPAWMADEYPDIIDGTKLNDYADLFKTPESGNKGAWYEGPPGYTTVGQKIIDSYGLDYKAINVGSEQALLDLFEKGQADKKPVLGYFWEPNYFLAKVDMVRVNFPANDWTDAAVASGMTDYPALDLEKLMSSKLADSGSPFATLVSNFTWTNADQNSVALDIENGMTAEEAAQKWIDANADTVASWMS